LEPMAFCCYFWAERTGQVAVIWKPVSIRVVIIVSQPVVGHRVSDATRASGATGPEEACGPADSPASGPGRAGPRAASG